MKVAFLLIILFVCTLLMAGNASKFITAYDAADYTAAAALMDEVDASIPEIARRLGVMLYDGRGISIDQEKGLQLLEYAMENGDTQAAINLVKIYFRMEKDVSKASWCLFVAETLDDAEQKSDVVKLREKLGRQYEKGLFDYINQIKGLLKSEQDLAREKSATLLKEQKNLQLQLNEMEVKNGELHREVSRLTDELADAKRKYELKLNDFENENNLLEGEISEANLIIAGERKKHQNEMTAVRKEAERLIDELSVVSIDESKKREKIRSDMIYTRYNQLIDKYNLLAKKYNKLLKRVKNK